MGIPARSIPLLVVCFIASATACIGADSQVQQVRVRPGAVKLPCNSNFTPEGFQVSESEAIAVAVGDRKVNCELVETEPMDNGTWAVHVDAAGPKDCELSVVIDGQTGEKLEGVGGCP